MNKFKTLLLFLPLIFLLSACNSLSKTEKKEIHICPQCNMELAKSNTHSSTLKQKSDTHYFDDIGCMVLWAKANSIDLKSVTTKIFSKDTKKYIDSFDAFYSMNEKTPMSYGFSAYEKKQESNISFDEVVIKMLRGEHMANPKIRKQILGY